MPDIWGFAAILVKLALYIGFAGSTGLVIVRCIYSNLTAPVRPLMQRQAKILAWLAFAATAFGFMLRGALLTGGIDGMANPEMLGLLWQTPVGDVLVYRLAGAALILVGLSVSRFGDWVALLGGALALWSFAQIGHMPGLAGFGAQLLLLLHLFCVAFWVGILSPLRNLSRMPDHLQDAAELGHRFGQVAAWVVPVLIVAGICMAWLLVGNLDRLLFAGYGQALLFKLVLVALLLTLAAANKLRFVPDMKSGQVKAAHHLARSIKVEAMIIFMVFATTATLTSVLTPPS